MKISNFRSVLLIVIMFTNSYAICGEIVLTGTYQGKNLYIVNPFSSSGGFCITSLKVNGQKRNEDINASAFEINLSNLKRSEKVKIVISHKDDCMPRVLNENVILPKSTFEVKTFRFDKKNLSIHFETIKESGVLPYVVEQFKWNKWVKVGTIDGLGNDDINIYDFPVVLHSGANRFRFRQRDCTEQDRFSKELTVRSSVPIVTYEPKKPSTSIKFSAETDYEIFNSLGKRVAHGRGLSVDISLLPKGDYFLNYDSKTETLKKK